MMFNIYEAKTKFSQLITMIESGQSVTIAKAGVPVADLVPHKQTKLTFGTMKGQIKSKDSNFEGSDADVQQMFYSED
jgi:antitoxin (DNA-binding transcriptional repressor) of toxin-antitoxin stability system